VVHVQQLAMPRKAARAFETGSALMHKYELQASVPYFRKAIKVAPDLFPAYHNLALVQFNFSDLDAAAQNFQKAIDLSKRSFAPSFFGLSVILYNRSQFAEAERAAQQGLVVEPGSALGQVGHSADALRINPGLAEAHFLLAHIHERLHHADAVITDVDAYFKNTLHDDVSIRTDALALRERAQQDLACASR
jgi:tetratricopeptide (TPR) repeat protein